MDEAQLIAGILLALRAQRDATPPGEIRSAYNAACDRLDVLHSHVYHAGPMSVAGAAMHALHELDDLVG